MVANQLDLGASTDIEDDHHHSDAAGWADACVGRNPDAAGIKALVDAARQRSPQLDQLSFGRPTPEVKAGGVDLRTTMVSLRHRARYSGLRGVLWRAVESCLAPIGQTGLESICRKDLTGPLETVTARADIDISQATEDDIDQLVELVESNWRGSDEWGPYSELGYRGTIIDRFDRGERCFVARVGADIVHYNWIALDREEAIAGTGLIASLAAGQEAVCHDGFTVESLRGRGIHPAVNDAMLRWLKEAGYRDAYTVVGTVARSSNITHHRLGWEFTGVMLYLISRRTGKARTWCLKGTLAPFEKVAG